MFCKLAFMAFVMLAVSSLSTPAEAAGLLVFGDGSLTPRESQLIQSFIKDIDAPELSDGFDLARVDLNEDAAAEFIVRGRLCEKGAHNHCTYWILAEREGAMISLGQIYARDMSLDNTYTNGVRGLRAYKNHVNDFVYDVYNWNANEQRFEN
jgi:hypothetical protein